MKDAISDCQLNHLKHEMTLCSNLASAPWGSCGRFAKYREAADEYFANCDETDSLFSTMYPHIVHDLWDGRPAAGYGTAAHMKEVWCMARDASIFHHKGDKVQLNRWFQFTQRWRQLQPFSSVLLLIIMYVGLHLQWWPSLDMSPIGTGAQQLDEDGRAGGQEQLGHQDLEGQPGQDDEGDAAEEGNPNQASTVRGHASGGVGRQVAGSSHIAEKQLGNRSSIYVVGDILGSKVHKSVFRGMCALSQPVELEHAETIRTHKTRQGSCQWWVKMAAGHWAPALGVVGKLSDPELLASMALHPALQGPASCTRLDQAEQEAVAQAMLSLAGAVCARELTYAAWFHYSLPGRFFALLSGDPGVACCLGVLQAILGCLASS